jgi:hypothetical protein
MAERVRGIEPHGQFICCQPNMAKFVLWQCKYCFSGSG